MRSHTRISFFPADFVNVADMTKWLRRADVNVNEETAGSTLRDLYDEIKAGKSKLVVESTTGSPMKSKSRVKVVRVLHVTNLVVLSPDKKTVLVEALREKSWKIRGKKVKKGQLPSIKLNRFGKGSETASDSKHQQHIFKSAADLLGKELQLETKWVNLRRSPVHTDVTERASRSVLELQGRYNVHSIFIDTNPESDTYVWRSSFSDKPRLSFGLAVAPEERDRLMRENEIALEKQKRAAAAHAAIAAAKPFTTMEEVKEGTIIHHWSWVPVGYCLNMATREALGIPADEKQLHRNADEEEHHVPTSGYGVSDFLGGRKRPGKKASRPSAETDAGADGNRPGLDMDGSSPSIRGVMDGSSPSIRGVLDMDGSSPSTRGVRATGRKHILDYGADKRGAYHAAAAAALGSGAEESFEEASFDDSFNGTSMPKILRESASPLNVSHAEEANKQVVALPRLRRVPKGKRGQALGQLSSQEQRFSLSVPQLSPRSSGSTIIDRSVVRNLADIGALQRLRTNQSRYQQQGKQLMR
jgi:hypothetical protein